MRKTICLLLVTLLLGACGQKSEDKKEPQKAATGGEKSLPDVGKVELVSVVASGMGISPSAAVSDALRSAILQVNGTSISSELIRTNFGVEVATSSKESGGASTTSLDTIKGQAFAEEVTQRSKGTISNFKVVSVEGSNEKNSYTAKIEAQIAKFKSPADSGKIKIVIAPLKSSKNSFNFAGEQVAAEQIAEKLRQQIIDALSQSGRFTILDRQFNAEVQGELGMIASGQAPDTDLAKIGQALSADLIWVGVINDFSYDKQVRKLETSDRELVSFSGGWSLSQRLVNVATRQILMSTTLQGKAPTIAPTTLGASVDKDSTLQTMQSDIINQATQAILLRTFPVSVVELDGTTVVLSQGGKSLAPQSRYKVFVLGKELKDPQTGQSLGKMEKYCCDVVIDRVTPTMSYGNLENVKVSLDGVKADSMQIREAVNVKDMSKQSDEKSDAVATSKASKSAVANRASAGSTATADAVKSNIKDKEW